MRRNAGIVVVEDDKNPNPTTDLPCVDGDPRFCTYTRASILRRDQRRRHSQRPCPRPWARNPSITQANLLPRPFCESTAKSFDRGRGWSAFAPSPCRVADPCNSREWSRATKRTSLCIRRGDLYEYHHLLGACFTAKTERTGNGKGCSYRLCMIRKTSKIIHGIRTYTCVIFSVIGLFYKQLVHRFDHTTWSVPMDPTHHNMQCIPQSFQWWNVRPSSSESKQTW